MSPALSQEMMTHFQTGLGILRWIVELGCLDILTEVLMLSAHNALPREGRLEAMYHIFSYLKGHKNSRIIFDPAYPTIDDRQFQTFDWADFYPDACNKLPPGMPESR